MTAVSKPAGNKHNFIPHVFNPFFFLNCFICFWQRKVFSIIAFLLICFLLCFLGRAICFFFVAFFFVHFVRLVKQYFVLALTIFAAVLVLFLLSFALLTPRLGHTCPTMSPLVFFYALYHPRYVLSRSETLLSTLTNHRYTHISSLHTHLWLCLCWRLFVFLRGCWPHCMCPCGCSCACWWVCTCFVCLLRCL